MWEAGGLGVLIWFGLLGLAAWGLATVVARVPASTDALAHISGTHL